MGQAKQHHISFRLHPLEEHLLSNGFSVIGIDEVGRGSSFGPLILGAFKLDSWFLDWLNGVKDKYEYRITDSKLLDHKRRAQLYRRFLGDWTTWFVDGISNIAIDSQGLGLAIKNFLPGFIERVVNYFRVPRVRVVFIFDGEKALNFNSREYNIIQCKRADSQFMSVSLASIVAKYIRDHLIIKKFHRKYPQYNLKQNKGYLTKTHIQAIKRYGPTLLHRYSFLNSSIIK